MKTNVPEYVRIGGLNGVCLRKEGNSYYRDAGAWNVRYILKGDKIFVNEPTGPANHLHNMELSECSEEEWRLDNQGYI